MATTRYFELAHDEHPDVPGSPLNSVEFWVADKAIRVEAGKVFSVELEPAVAPGEDAAAAAQYAAHVVEALLANPLVKETQKPKAAPAAAPTKGGDE